MQRILKSIISMMLMMLMLVYIGCNKQKDKDVRVTTYTPQNITHTTAKCGGDVIVTQGLSLDELGVCWSTERNPTVKDAHLSTTNWTDTYVCTVTSLEPSTKYHVRAYALRGLEYYYGEDKNFITKGDGSGSLNGHKYVDLGLPSGTLWATCNVGANIPEEYGDYYAWGETSPKEVYDWNSYKYGSGSMDAHILTKYNTISFYGVVDNLSVLQPNDDAATVNWGNGWCMPSGAQWLELRLNVNSTWENRNGVYGCLFTSSNGNSLFLPAACNGWDEDFSYTYDNYWSSSLYVDDPIFAQNFVFPSNNNSGWGVGRCGREAGLQVRAVRSFSRNKP